MPKVTYIAHNGSAQIIEVPVGENVMRGAIYNNVNGIVGECGGALSCATCHVYVDETWFPKTGAISEVEQQMIEYSALDPKPNSRLSCQITMSDDLDGLVVHLPEKQF